MSLFSVIPAFSRRAAIAVCLLCCGAASAQSPAPARQEIVHFGTFENDMMFDTDRYYTNGVQFSVKGSRDRRGRFVRGLTERACGPLGCEGSTLLTTQTNFGQLMYTPNDITVAAPQPLDRPWAGLLYVEQSYALLSPDRRTLTTLTAQAGVTGPASLAEDAQKLFHRMLDRPLPQGWHNQVGGSLAVMASAERRTAIDGLSATFGDDIQVNTAGYWRLAAGNIMSYAAGGLAVVVGKDLPDVSPPPPGIGNKLAPQRFGLTTCMVRWLQCTTFGVVESRVMARSIFLDGRLFHNDRKVKRRNFVTDLMVGMRLDFPDTRTASHGPWFVQLKVTRRSREFSATIPVPRHRMAAITLGTEF
ncbi:lipid A deacylase LpxR family protein [Massilia cavernae]|uniref:Lipid A deacylase LpxR family protein n=1 Tax=Massilia cavernae TaxID=2320864 RepID=A0A418XTS7_9BURK|nr:lipid A deacylase LpxR family protein [Massilia cavernae]RJG16092.1 lipid A deacylase LpxR family protein [Massilia cavernae]